MIFFLFFFFFFFNDTATTEIYTLSLHDALPISERVKELASSPRAPDVYVVTNNHFRGQAPANAKMLEAMVEGRTVEAPAELVAAYEEAMRPFAVPVGAPEQR